jgi:hypothetical protein
VPTHPYWVALGAERRMYYPGSQHNQMNTICLVGWFFSLAVLCASAAGQRSDVMRTVAE